MTTPCQRTTHLSRPEQKNLRKCEEVACYEYLRRFSSLCRRIPLMTYRGALVDLLSLWRNALQPEFMGLARPPWTDLRLRLWICRQICASFYGRERSIGRGPQQRACFCVHCEIMKEESSSRYRYVTSITSDSFLDTCIRQCVLDLAWVILNFIQTRFTGASR